MIITNGLGINSANFSKMQNTNNNANDDGSLKSIQKQIENVQKELQNLSNNDKMSDEEKESMRKELQQELQDLSRQAAQRRMEIQQEKSEKTTGSENQESTLENETQASVTLETDSMKGLISADVSIKRAGTLNSVKTSMEGNADILNGQIKADGERGSSTDIKETELADLNEKINGASSDMMAKISDINKKITKSRKDDNTKGEDNKDSDVTFNSDNSLSDSDSENNSEKIVVDDDNSKTGQFQNYFNTQIPDNQQKGQYINIKL